MLLEAVRRAGNLKGFNLVYSARQKNAWTIIEKLRRDQTELHRIRDVVGLRFVLGDGCGRLEQDQVIAQLGKLFPDDPKKVDRRSEPKSGYRALHLIATCEGRPVEIQVRTRLQDRWAQAFEKAADMWGRGIRYGEEPREPQQTIRNGTSTTVAEVLQYLSQLSEAIDDAEIAKQNGAPDADDLLKDANDLFLALRDLEDLPGGFEQPRGVVDGPYFLVVYNQAEGRTLLVQGFREVQAAAEEHRAYDERHRHVRGTEIVLLASESFETLRQTHARYFKDFGALAGKAVERDVS